MFPVFSPQARHDEICNRFKDGGLLSETALDHFGFNTFKLKNKLIKLFKV